MQHKVFSIRDGKGEFFMQPFQQKTMGEAERTFIGIATSPESIVSKFPEDFDLYYLGDFDDRTGKYSPLDTPQHIQKAVLALDTKKPQ